MSTLPMGPMGPGPVTTGVPVGAGARQRYGLRSAPIPSPPPAGLGARSGPRVAAVALVVVAALAAATVLGPPPAAAHSAAANGCTGVPDSGYGFEFHASCDQHDRCYGSQPYGSGTLGRSRCDRVFRSEMLRYCERHWRLSLKRAVCESVAWAYYGGVRALGYPYWAKGVATPIA